MHIALFTDGIYPYVMGGLQKHSYELARALGRQGVQVDLYAAVPHDQVTEAWRKGLYDAPEPNVTVRFVARPAPPYFPGHYLWQSREISHRLLDAYLAAEPADFLYTQGFTGWAALDHPERKTMLPPIGVNQHGLEMYQRVASNRGWLEQRLLRPAVTRHLRQADVALSLGGGLGNIIRLAGTEAFRVIESPNGVGEEWMADHPSEPHTPRRLVFVGRYERRKGVEELHEALTALDASGSPYEMQFVGPIPDEMRLSHPQVKYWGMVREPEKLRGILREADILVCPSYSEGMPTVILEAMASGLAILATQVGAVDAMVDDTCGWMLRPSDAEALASALRAAVTCSDADLQQKKQHALDRVRARYLWPQVAATTRQNIERWLNKHAEKQLAPA